MLHTLGTTKGKKTKSRYCTLWYISRGQKGSTWDYRNNIKTAPNPQNNNKKVAVMCRSLSCIHTVNISDSFVSFSSYACISIRVLAQWPVWATSEKKGDRISKGDGYEGNRQSRTGHTDKVANGCWGLIDCFASRRGACEAGWLWLGTWNKVNEVTTWQRGRPGRSQNVCWLLQARMTYTRLQRDNRAYDSDCRDSGGFGDYVQLLHIWDTSLKN